MISKRWLPLIQCPKCKEKSLSYKSYPDENVWGLAKRLITCSKCQSVYDKVK